MKDLDPLFSIPPPPSSTLEMELSKIRRQIARMSRRQKKMQALLSSTAAPQSSSGLSHDHFFKILDGLDMALFSLQREEDERLVRNRRGLEILLRKGLELLEQQGITSIPGVGALFDSKLHKASGTVERPELPDYTIVQQDRRGYRRGDQVLRPAEVVVNRISKNPS
jgi:molecular chaperone GrpE (heat shock protein)